MQRIAAVLGQAWSGIVRAVSFEFVLTHTRYPNGSAVIVFRSAGAATVLYLSALLVRSLLDPAHTGAGSLHQFRLQLASSMPWYGTLFAGMYASLYSRYASQWTYLANVYNRIKEAQTRALNTDAAARALIEWKAAFIEDAEDLHLACKPMFASVIREWGRDSAVEQTFVQHALGGGERWRALVDAVVVACARHEQQRIRR